MVVPAFTGFGETPLSVGGAVASVTDSVTAKLVTLPALFVITTENSDPLSAMLAIGVV